jgi:hypothetical protein
MTCDATDAGTGIHGIRRETFIRHEFGDATPSLAAAVREDAA